VALAVMLMVGPSALAATLPPGVWEGAVEYGGAVVAARVTLDKLEVGDHGSVMRWFSPHNCSMILEYAAKRDGAYELRIFSSNGGWCDTYRGGALDLTAESAASLKFSLTDKKGGRALKGELSPAE
jgi:hypothetical protein